MKTLTTSTLLLWLGLLWAGALFAETAAEKEIHWIDVRTPWEYLQEHVDGATRIPYDEIGEGITELGLAKDARIYLYCGSGGRAEKAREALVARGYTDVVNIGGLSDAQQLLEAQE